jgi:hypothetical protein
LLVGWIVKWYGKYGWKVSQIVIKYGQHGRKASWNVKWYGKDGRKITVILLNVALNTINLTLYLQRHILTYLSIYIFIRIIDFI